MSYKFVVFACPVGVSSVVCLAEVAISRRQNLLLSPGLDENMFHLVSSGGKKVRPGEVMNAY